MRPVFHKMAPVLSCLSLLSLPLAAGAQQGEIFIPGSQGSETLVAPTEPQTQNRLAACLVRPDAETCSGLDIDPEGLAFESAVAGPSVTFETLVLDLDEQKVAVAPEPPASQGGVAHGAPATDYSVSPGYTGRVTLPSVAITIDFDYDSAAIRADQYGKMTSLIEAFTDPALSGTHYAVIGHTDASGSEGYNCDLSLRRAPSVAGALQANYVSLTLYAVGFGEYVLKNAYDPGSAENRRVTFLRLPDDPGSVLGTVGAVCAY